MEWCSENLQETIVFTTNYSGFRFFFPLSQWETKIFSEHTMGSMFWPGTSSRGGIHTACGSRPFQLQLDGKATQSSFKMRTWGNSWAIHGDSQLTQDTRFICAGSECQQSLVLWCHLGRAREFPKSMELSGRSKKPEEEKSRTSITCCIFIQIHSKNPWISRASQFLFSFVSLINGLV